MNDFSNDTAGRLKTNTRYRDPDLDAAYEELDDFLNNKERKNDAPRGAAGGEKVPPLELREDFECLGVPFGADAETCKSAYKKLLKIHHPDRHAGHEGNYKKATEKSARINAAWDRIERWRNS
jgi:DnaJ-class molecular chaperone